MSLIKCPECGQTVSDKATACPHCGYPFDNPNTQYDSDITIEIINATISSYYAKREDAFAQFVKARELFYDNGALDGGHENIQQFIISEGKFVVSLKECIVLLSSLNERIKSARERNYNHPIRNNMVIGSSQPEFKQFIDVMEMCINATKDFEYQFRPFIKDAREDVIMAYSFVNIILEHQKKEKALFEDFLNIGATWV